MPYMPCRGRCMLYRTAYILFGILCMDSILSCSRAIRPETRFALGTVCTVNLYNDGTKKLYDEIFTRIDRIEQAVSVTIPTSAVSAINAAAGKHPVPVSRDVLTVVQAAISYAELTQGAFDPTIGPLVKLWGINTDTAHVPSSAEIDAVLPLINWRDVAVSVNSFSQQQSNAAASASEELAGTVFLKRAGMALDLGGIAKGYVADEIIRILRARKVKRAVIDLGGNIYVFGTKADGSRWRVGVKNPVNPDSPPALMLSLDSATVVTSGVYERFFVADGIRYHHILNPFTGYPADTDVLSTTIVSTNSMASDALSTSIFLLGVENGIELLHRMSAEGDSPNSVVHDGVDGIFITEDGIVVATKALEGRLSITHSYAGTLVFR